ncbi:MAG TPA: hypothetical protein DD000_07075, partial [Cyanobacteria bacterium UBA11166]|nr:hypothetical protein [Cyanobacteria bacterium UBA11166]
GSLDVNASESIQLIGTSLNGQILSSLFTATTGGGKGGDLTITTPKLHLQDGAEILAGTFGSGDGGNLIVNASESVQLIGTSANGKFASGLLNVTTGTGNGGDSIITTPQLLIQDGGILQSGSFGSGKGGNLIVNASESVQLIGTSTDGIVPSSLYTQTQGTGNGGDLTMITPQLLIADGGFVGSDTFGVGKGGNLIVNASDSVQVLGTSTDGEIFSRLIAQVYPDAEGDGGNLTITTGKLTVSDGARVSTATLGAGNAGALTIETQQLRVGGGALVQTTSFGSGNAGVLTVNASESVDLIGISPDNKFASGLYSQTQGIGNANELIISTPRLLIQEGAQVSTGTFGSGKGGSLIIKDSELVQVTGTSPNGKIPSRLSTTTAEGAQGRAGDLTIITGNFIVQNGAQVSAGTVGSGNGGNFIIKASESVQVMGRTTDEQFASGLFTQTEGVGDAGDLTIITPLLLVEDGSLISASTLGLGDAGNLIVNASKSVQLIGTSTNGEAVSGLATQTRGEGDAGDLIIITPELLVQDGARVSTGTFDAGNGGTLTVNAAKRVQLIGTSPNGQISSALVAQANNNSTGDAGDLILTTPQLLIQDGAVVSTGTLGSGDGGNLIVIASESVEIISRNNDSKISSGLFTQTQGIGNAGDLTIITGKFLVQDGARVSARTLASGNGGNLIVNASQSLQVIGISSDGKVPSSLSSSNEGGGIGEAGELTITTPQLLVKDGAQVSAGTNGSGNGANLIVNASESVQLIGTSSDGKISSGLFTSTIGTGNAGDLTITTPQLQIQNGAQVSASTFNQGEGGKLQIDTNSLTLNNQAQITTRATGEGNAGPISINVNGLLTAKDSDISTNSSQSAGGAITITAENIRLFGDSDIKTNVSQGVGGGGNITIKADTIIAFDDSDILAFARDGKGGDITLDTQIFFGSSFAFAPKNTDPETLDINDRVDINASGAISGTITIPDVSFIENSLTELPDNLVDPDSLIANSCIARSTKQTGNFIITGSGGLPLRPQDPNLSPYPTGTVRNIPNDTSSTNNKPTDSWQIGDPIIEPQGVYQLPSGKLVMSRECSPSNP